MSKMVLITVPKSGTHYMLSLLGLPNKPRVTRGTHDDQYMKIKHKLHIHNHLWGHIYYTPDIEDAIRPRKIVFLYRDPRDIIVSYAAYRYKDDHPYNFSDIDLAIRDCRHRMKQIAPWYDHADLVIRYEELLLNPKGTIRQLQSVWPKTRYDLVGKKAETYRRGGIGDWKLYFNQLQLLYYKMNYKFCGHWEWEGETL